MMKKWYCFSLILTLLVLVGCASQNGTKPEATLKTARTPPPLFVDMSNTPIVSEDEMTVAVKAFIAETDEKDIPTLRFIYFDYDDSEITSEAYVLLEEHADYLLDKPDTLVRLEGHADERGSYEYNLALTERRVEAAKEALIELGILEDQLSTLGYGDEHPVAFEQNETDWQLNRRVELIYP